MSANLFRPIGTLFLAASMLLVASAHAQSRANRSPASMTTAQTLRQKVPALPTYKVSSTNLVSSSKLSASSLDDRHLGWLGNLNSPKEMTIGQYAARSPSHHRMPASVTRGLGFAYEP